MATALQPQAERLSAQERQRYQRHLTLTEIGTTGQLKLRGARVLIVGAGGLGSPAALYLAAAGCGTIGLVDCDRVELSNLQRQLLFETSDVGAPKATAGAARLQAINPDIRIHGHALELDADNVRILVADYDLVLDGSDRLSTRYLVNDACVILRRPLVTAAIHRFEGQVMTCLPGHSACYRCAFPQLPDGAVGSCAQAGVLGVLPGVLGTLQATEAIKLITGIGDPLAGRLLTYDALELRFSEFQVPRRADCAVCGDHPVITAATFATACATAPGDSMTHDPTPAALRRLSAADLHALLQAASAPQLVDVREPVEFAAGHLAGSVNIPLAQLPRRLGEVDAQRQPVFICRVGGRSMAACGIALQAGIASPGNLEGGMLAWAAQIDPSLQVL